MAITASQLRDELREGAAVGASIEATIADWQERLRRHAAKMELWRQALAFLEAEEPSQPPLAADWAPAAPPAAQPRREMPRPRYQPKNAAMEDAIDRRLSEGVPVHRQQLLETLVAHQIMGAEKNPLGHLASFLSDRKHKYQSDGKGYFTLRPQNQPEPHPGADVGQTDEVTEELKPASGDAGKDGPPAYGDAGGPEFPARDRL